MNVLLIASLTLREASRRRLVLAAAIATVVLVALTALGFHALATMHTREGKPISHQDVLLASSVLEIMMAFMFSFVLALAAAFLGALSTGAEIENGTLLTIVPRPIRRPEIIAGKWLGNAVLLAAYAFVIGTLEFAAVRWTTGYLPPHPLQTLTLLVGQSIVLLTLTMAISVRLPAIAAGFATVVLFGIAWIAGVVGTFATVFHNAGILSATTLISLIIPSDGLWRAASFSMQPAIIQATTPSNNVNPLVPSAPPPTAFFLWCLFWFAIVLSAATASFQQRDI
jgi:ABC-type transport system involved in multi-copper enzyme maturation permease subunit